MCKCYLWCKSGTEGPNELTVCTVVAGWILGHSLMPQLHAKEFWKQKWQSWSNIILWTVVGHFCTLMKFINLSPVAYLPLLFCMLGFAPVFSRASAIRAMPLITSAECFLGLKEQTKWRGVSTAPTVAAFTWAEWRIRKMDANSSPGSRVRKKYLEMGENCLVIIKLLNKPSTHLFGWLYVRGSSHSDPPCPHQLCC